MDAVAFFNLLFAAYIPYDPSRLNRVEDIEVRLYYGPTINDSSTYRLPQLNNLFNHPNFDKAKSTLFYFHGYTEDPNSGTFQSLIKAFLGGNKGKNLCMVDWSNMADGDYFGNAAPNTLKVGAAVATQLISAINANLISASKIEPIGISLGGQLVGFLGRSMKAQGVILKTIISLDPAGPWFFPFNSTGDTIKKTDAQNVYAIHTNAFVLGTSASVGTHDFWVNGGALQRGCIGQRFECSHGRSLDYYIEYLTNPQAFAATRLNSYVEFMIYLFPNPFISYIFMVPSSTTTAPQGDYFLVTNYASPYGRGLNGRYYSL